MLENTWNDFRKPCEAMPVEIFTDVTGFIGDDLEFDISVQLVSGCQGCTIDSSQDCRIKCGEKFPGIFENKHILGIPILPPHQNTPTQKNLFCEGL